MSQSNFLEILTVPMAAGEVRNFMVSGAYFEVIDATSAIDVRLTDKFGAVRGAMRNAEASFYLRASEFDVIEITSAAAQVIRIAFGTAEAGTRRTAGVVSVIDGERNRTNQGGSFIARLSSFPGAGNLAHAQIWNPPGSGKTAIIDTIEFSQQSAGIMTIGRLQTAITNLAPEQPTNCLAGSLAASASQSRIVSQPALNVGLVYASNFAAANTQNSFTNAVRKRPIVLRPGNGIIIASEVLASGITGYVSFFEENE